MGHPTKFQEAIKDADERRRKYVATILKDPALKAAVQKSQVPEPPKEVAPQRRFA